MNFQNDATCLACGCQMNILHRRGSSQVSRACPVCGCETETPRISSPVQTQGRGRRKIASPEQVETADRSVATGYPAAAPGTKRRVAAPGRPYGHRDVDHFRTILLAMREETLTDLRNYEEALRNITDNQSSDTYDDDVAIQLNASFAATSLEELAGLRARQGKLLEHIDAALERVESGQYGLCRSCRRRIPRERLDAVPHATLCLLCKTGRAA